VRSQLALRTALQPAAWPRGPLVPICRVSAATAAHRAANVDTHHVCLTTCVVCCAHVAGTSPQTNGVSKAGNYTWAMSAPDAFVPVNGATFSYFSATCFFFGRWPHQHDALNCGVVWRVPWGARCWFLVPCTPARQTPTRAHACVPAHNRKRK